MFMKQYRSPVRFQTRSENGQWLLELSHVGAGNEAWDDYRIPKVQSRLDSTNIRIYIYIYIYMLHISIYKNTYMS